MNTPLYTTEIEMGVDFPMLSSRGGQQMIAVQVESHASAPGKLGVSNNAQKPFLSLPS